MLNFSSSLAKTGLSVYMAYSMLHILHAKYEGRRRTAVHDVLKYNLQYTAHLKKKGLRTFSLQT